MNDNITELIKKISKKDYKCSEGWKNMTKNLKNYLENSDINLYKINNINPKIFHWPEMGATNGEKLKILENDKESIFYKTILKNSYGPKGIYLHKNIQLDRVAQVWYIYNLVNMKLNLNHNEIILEFGGGTGQMADVLSCLKFKGRHIVYDLPLITILQRYFVNKQNIKSKYILDDDSELNLIVGTNYLPCNQIKSEKYIMGRPNINFIATFSLTETDIDTHNKFSEYIKNFSRIYISYSLNMTVTEDYIDNEAYIQKIKNNIENTHYCFIYPIYNFGNSIVSKTFIAIKKELISSEEKDILHKKMKINITEGHPTQPIRW